MNDDKIQKFLVNYSFSENVDLNNFQSKGSKTIVEDIEINGEIYSKYINEYWTSKQRKASSIHEISYRACFKPQLPAFFIKLLTDESDYVYDPFSGRGTTVIEAAILGRNIVTNDVNPLSKILTEPRLHVPELNEIKQRLDEIPFNSDNHSDIDLSMFYSQDTESEIVSLKKYLFDRKKRNSEDFIDKWIRMVATNRLTGHSKGFFSVYTLPPNQAVSQDSQRKINEKRKQQPEYRDVKAIIVKKSKSLIRNLTNEQKGNLLAAGDSAIFLSTDARKTGDIESNSIKLTVTSPPFLNIVQYSKDNWLRCWFNSLDSHEISNHITMANTIQKWSEVMCDVFKELFRITTRGGFVAFEVGEVKNGTLKLDEYIVPLGISAGFQCLGVIVNLQEFTKTSNIWGVNNNNFGTNTNRIVLFKKI